MGQRRRVVVAWASGSDVAAHAEVRHGNHFPRPHAQQAERPFLGLRRRPGRAALVLMRMPLRAYRHDDGWMLGRTFIAFTHVGRKSGRPYDAVAMVLSYEATTGEAVIFAAWGPQTDWYRNLRAGPSPRAWLGRDTFEPEVRFLSDDEAFRVAKRFRRDHPYRLRLACSVLGWGELAGRRGISVPS